MTLLHRLPLAILLLLLLPLQSLAGDGRLSIESAINKAGLQRMLSQRMVTKYCLTGLGVLPKESRAAILEDAALFEQQLHTLKAFSDDEVYQESLEWVTIAWDRFRPLVTGEVSQERVRRINHLSEDLLYTSHKVVMMLQEMGSRPIDRLVNLAGRQRMLSQRMAKLYLMRSWGEKSLSIDDDLVGTGLEFEETMERLRTSPEATPLIRQDIDKALVQWNWFKSVINRPGGDASYRLIIADASDALYRMMDQITRQFEMGSGR